MQIQAPDIGVDKAVVAEILVKVGDHVAVEDSLLVLESDNVASFASEIIYSSFCSECCISAYRSGRNRAR